MLDSFAVGNIIGDNLSLKGRILVDQIPSGRYHLTTILDAMRDNHVVKITHKAFHKESKSTFKIEPYCVKLFANRWYVVAYNPGYDDIRSYALDRIETSIILNETFKMPKDFSAEEYFSRFYGIVTSDGKPERIILRASRNHTPYLESLPMHHSQRLLESNGEYADFELYLVPTYDFIMGLLQVGSMIEVLEPTSLHREMKGWSRELYNLYKND
jgi:predicted DNA-binding transcriptional regulator YafY